MRKLSLSLILLLVATNSYSQQNSWKRFDVQAQRDFRVESLHTVVDMSGFGESVDTIRASLLIDDNIYDAIRFAKAFCKNGDLFVLIYETNESSRHKYMISIVKNKFKVTYNYISSGENEDDGLMVPLETRLVLNTSDFKVGTLLKGYTEFKGTCGNCKDSLIVKGNFQVLIK
jgi:hypothetical protein